MAHYVSDSFGNALALLEEHEETGSTALSLLEIPHADSSSAFSYSQARLSDVAHALWSRRPELGADIMTIRIQSLPSDDKEKVYETMEELRSHMNSVRPLTRRRSNSTLPLRHWRVNDGGLQSKDLVDAAALVCGHATLASLALQANDIVPTIPYMMKTLGHAVSLSNLRILDLSNNAIGTRSMVELLDNLHTPSLTRLYLSMTMQRSNLERDQEENPLWRTGDQTWTTSPSSDALWKAEIAQVTDRLVRLVKHDTPSPYAPRLEWLTLNGNDLGWKSVRRLVDTIRENNYCLEHVELFATTEADGADVAWGGSDTDEDDSRGITDLPRADLRRATSIGSHMVARRREALAGQMEERVVAESDDISRPFSSTGQHFRSPFLQKPRLTPDNWRGELGRHMNVNTSTKWSTKDASRKLLRTVRTLTCKSHEAESIQSSNENRRRIFPFARLPPEIRQRIVMHLDEVNTLHQRQTERIISFASDPATIGYGHRSENLGLSAAAINAIHQETQDASVGVEQMDVQSDYGFLLHRSFRWSDMIARHSVPRDWPATVLDEVVSMRDAIPCAEDDRSVDVGGGGGGGRRGPGSTRNGHNHEQISNVRRFWLAEQSGLQAFWEATGTYALER